MPGPTVVCLLPARNEAANLPGFLESAARVCDAVVALDDGSIDDTGDLLRGSPLVAEVLANPRRETYHGWHDGQNRNRLLEAAGRLHPDWVISLDSDDRIDLEDAKALREFLETDALPGCGYGFAYHRMWEGDTYDPDIYWVFRLFAYRPGQAFTNQRNHNVPIPTGIARAAYVRTTIRIRHYGASNEEERLGRQTKYSEADPEGVVPTDFGGLNDRPDGELPRWQPRGTDLPVVIPL